MSRSIWRSSSWVWRSWGSGTSRWKGSTWVWAPLVRGVGTDVRTTQSPAGRGASPTRAGGRAGQPADPQVGIVLLLWPLSGVLSLTLVHLDATVQLSGWVHTIRDHRARAEIKQTV